MEELKYIESGEFYIQNEKPYLKITYKDKPEMIEKLKGKTFSFNLTLNNNADTILMMLDRYYDYARKERLAKKEEIVNNTKSTTKTLHEIVCTCGNVYTCINKNYYISRLLYVLEVQRKNICDVEVIDNNKLRFK